MKNKTLPSVTKETRTINQYMAFIKLKDVKGTDVSDTSTVWSCDELDIWVDYDKDKKPLGIQIIFTNPSMEEK